MPGGLEFVDTNVLVYAYDRAGGEKRARAIALLERLVAQRRLALSLQVLQEFYVVATRKLPVPLEPQVAYQSLKGPGQGQAPHPFFGGRASGCEAFGKAPSFLLGCHDPAKR
jgi:hypothetical protein